jgi:FkbM family methyltransferase
VPGYKVVSKNKDRSTKTTIVLQRLASAVGRLSATALCWAFREPSSSTFVHLGTDYGGWICAANPLQPGANALCVGAGEDVSFDVELVSRFKVNVICVDPTPRSIRHVHELLAGSASYDLRGFNKERFIFLPVALWHEDGTLRLYVPADPRHVSHSAVNLQGTSQFIEAPCVRLTTLMKQRQIDDLTLMKLDIEGAECAVLEDLLRTTIRPKQLLIEFDSLFTCKPGPIWRVVRIIRNLRSAGYRLARAQRANFTFELAS